MCVFLSLRLVFTYVYLVCVCLCVPVFLFSLCLFVSFFLFLPLCVCARVCVSASSQQSLSGRAADVRDDSVADRKPAVLLAARQCLQHWRQLGQVCGLRMR